MNFFSHRVRRVAGKPAIVLSCAIACVLALAAGCKSGSHTSDPRLKPIEQIIDQNFPPGTTRDRVDSVLRVRGYDTAPVNSGDKLIATIQRVDLDTLQPVVARVTFHFDSNDKLVSYDLAPAPVSGP